MQVERLVAGTQKLLDQLSFADVEDQAANPAVEPTAGAAEREPARCTAKRCLTAIQTGHVTSLFLLSTYTFASHRPEAASLIQQFMS
jgi:hypothetical protein